jgi:hypothetical protein
VIYDSPFTSTLKNVKLLSFSSLCLAWVATPVILFFPTEALPTLSSRLALAALTAIIGTITTLSLTRVSRTYVCRVVRLNDVEVQLDDAARSALDARTAALVASLPFVAIETCDMRARTVRSVHHVSALRPFPPADAPYVTMANLYVHTPRPHENELSAFFIHPELALKAPELLIWVADEKKPNDTQDSLSSTGQPAAVAATTQPVAVTTAEPSGDKK